MPVCPKKATRRKKMRQEVGEELLPEPPTGSQHPVKFIGHNSCESGDIHFPNCHVTHIGHVIKESSVFKGESLQQ